MATTSVAAPGSNVDLFKVLLVGESGVGKTSICKRAVHGIFATNYKATVGVDFGLKTVAVAPTERNPEGKVKLQLWDIAGQERFQDMTRVYYKEAVAAIIVYDKTKLASYQAVTAWKEDIDKKITLSNGEPIPVFLFGNKCDLPAAEHFPITGAEISRFVQDHKFTQHFDTSAKDNINLDDAMKRIAETILLKGALKGAENPNDGTISLHAKSETADSGGCPC